MGTLSDTQESAHWGLIAPSLGELVSYDVSKDDWDKITDALKRARERQNKDMRKAAILMAVMYTILIAMLAFGWGWL
jgi:hypothetical protein